MSENTKIEWCDHTFNPWEGCQKVGPGCDHCYAEVRNARFSGGQAINWGPGAPRRRTSPANWHKPLAWNANHTAFFAEHGRRQRVFCASLADVFDNQIDPQWRADLADLIQGTPNLDWLLLTKRIGNADAMLVDMFLDGAPDNLILGVTIVNQIEANRDIPKLLSTAVSRRFLSMEPLLEPVDLGCIDAGIFAAKINVLTGMWKWENGPRRKESPAIDWIIVGGESGPGARPMNPYWARSVRDQCVATGVPFLFKQWGEWIPYEFSAQAPFFQSQHGQEIDGHLLPDFESDEGQGQKEWRRDWANDILVRRVGKKAAGRKLDGVEHNGFPE